MKRAREKFQRGGGKERGEVGGYLSDSISGATTSFVGV